MRCGDDARLAAAGAGEHERGAVAGGHRLALRRIQIIEEVGETLGHHAIVPAVPDFAKTADASEEPLHHDHVDPSAIEPALLAIDAHGAEAEPLVELHAGRVEGNAASTSL